MRISTFKPVSAIRKTVCLLGIVASLSIPTAVPALAAPLPDLVVTGMTLNSSTCVATFKIRNNGTGSATGPIRIRVSPQGWLLGNIPGLAAGQSIEQSSIWSVASTNGYGYYLSIQVDPQDVVKEVNEDNNSSRFFVRPSCVPQNP